MLKKTWLLLVVLFIVGVGGYFSLSPQHKLTAFVKLEKPWVRMHPGRPSSFINQEKLDQKIAQGLPDWALAQINSDLSKFLVIHPHELDAAFEKNNTEHNKLVRFKIVDGKLQSICRYPNLVKSVSYRVMHNVLNYLVKNQYIHELDMILSLQDFVELS